MDRARTVDFRNTIVLFTSNLGSQYLVDAESGKMEEKAESRVLETVKSHFRPEFLNRLNGQIVFRKLHRNEMLKIVEIQLERFIKLFESRKIHLS